MNLDRVISHLEQMYRKTAPENYSEDYLTTGVLNFKGQIYISLDHDNKQGLGTYTTLLLPKLNIFFEWDNDDLTSLIFSFDKNYIILRSFLTYREKIERDLPIRFEKIKYLAGPREIKRRTAIHLTTYDAIDESPVSGILTYSTGTKISYDPSTEPQRDFMD